MRRKDREVKDFDKIIDILESCDCCRLGLLDNNSTYILPLNFGYKLDGEKITLYFHTAKEGKKLDLINNAYSASFEMDTNHELVIGDSACNFSFKYQCIMGKGKISILNCYHGKVNALNCIMKKYSEKSDWEFSEKMVNSVNIIKLEVTEFSCKEHV